MYGESSRTRIHLTGRGEYTRPPHSPPVPLLPSRAEKTDPLQHTARCTARGLILEAAGGFEPPYDGFANRCLRPLGYAAVGSGEVGKIPDSHGRRKLYSVDTRSVRLDGGPMVRVGRSGSGRRSVVGVDVHVGAGVEHVPDAGGEDFVLGVLDAAEALGHGGTNAGEAEPTDGGGP